MNLLHRELIRQAIEEARAGDRVTALKHLAEVLGEDPENTKAWLLFARLVDDPEEKIVALHTILDLEPDNEKAHQLLDKLEADSASDQDEEVIPGVTRRQVTMIGGGLVGVVAVLILVIVVININNKNQEDRRQRQLEQAQTQQARQIQQATAVLETETQVAIQATETQMALTSPTPITPTATATFNRPTLPATFTPTPTPTEVGAATLPFPTHLTGLISGWSGLDLVNEGALPLALYTLDGVTDYQMPEIITSDTELGLHANADPAGTQIIYSEYIRLHSRLDVRLVDLYGREIPSNVNDAFSYGGYNLAYMPIFSPDSTQIAFIGHSLDSQTAEVYLLSVYDDQQIEPIRLTNDESNYSYPAFSPDGTQIVVVRESPNSPENPGPDLVLINIASATLQSITFDNDLTYESMPRWSPQGLIAYTVSSQPTDEGDNDIWVIPPDGRGNGIRLIEEPGDDIYPVFSPDGAYLAFASNRTGYYDIYIVNMTSRELFQLTSSREKDYPGSWVNLPEGR